MVLHEPGLGGWKFKLVNKVNITETATAVLYSTVMVLPQPYAKVKNVIKEAFIVELISLLISFCQGCLSTRTMSLSC